MVLCKPLEATYAPVRLFPCLDEYLGACGGLEALAGRTGLWRFCESGGVGVSGMGEAPNYPLWAVRGFLYKWWLDFRAGGDELFRFALGYVDGGCDFAVSLFGFGGDLATFTELPIRG